jgi:hypothetical protein
MTSSHSAGAESLNICNWIGGLNHNLQHITSKKPNECPTSTTVCEPSIY